jgi:adenosylmethionine-8-amino-7-oxononanoate aminotransferase
MTKSNLNYQKIWRPYTQEANSPPALKIKKAKDSILYLEDGRELLDCISSWWLNIHGHNVKEISEAISNQFSKLEQVVFADFCHESAEELTELLSKIVPKNLNHYFFSDDGSTAVEVAIKMALGFWNNQGIVEKNTFIAFDGAYHGDTFGAMSVSARSMFTRSLEKILFKVEFVPFPNLNNDSNLQLEEENKSLEKIERLLNENKSSIAGIIIEPLVQGASGMRMCSENFLRKLNSLIIENNTLLICDEVMTGFGRTGEWFASQKANISPDVICLSKGLTGGVLPMGLSITTEKVFSAFNSGNFEKTLFHGHSFTGNALSCAAAVASLKLFSKVGERFRNFEAIYKEYYNKYLLDIPSVINPRFCGTIFAFEVKYRENSDNSYGNKKSLEIKSRLMNEGIYLRPLGNTLYLMPPYCFSEREIEFTFEKFYKVLQTL